MTAMINTINSDYEAIHQTILADISISEHLTLSFELLKMEYITEGVFLCRNARVETNIFVMTISGDIFETFVTFNFISVPGRTLREH